MKYKDGKYVCNHYAVAGAVERFVKESGNQKYLYYENVRGPRHNRYEVIAQWQDGRIYTKRGYHLINDLLSVHGKHASINVIHTPFKVHQGRLTKKVMLEARLLQAVQEV